MLALRLRNGTSYSFEVRAIDRQSRPGAAATVSAMSAPIACNAPVLGERREVWSGTVRVGRQFGGLTEGNFGLGWASAGYGENAGDEFGSLNPGDSFTIGGVSYTIEELYSHVLSGGTTSPFGLILSSRLADALRAALKLHWCSESTGLVEEQSSGRTLYNGTNGESPDWSLRNGDLAVALSLPPNNDATGTPDISGTATPLQTLSAAIGTIADEDGLPGTFPDDYTFQWVRVDADGTSNSADIEAATSNTYVLTTDDIGKRVRVHVGFTDQLGGEETRKSQPTINVQPTGPPLTAEFQDAPARHDGRLLFSVILRFSENVSLSAGAFGNGLLTIVGGTRVSQGRVTAGDNIAWQINVRPDGQGDVTITLPANAACGDPNTAPCTPNGRRLSAPASVTVAPPIALPGCNPSDPDELWCGTVTPTTRSNTPWQIGFCRVTCNPRNTGNSPIGALSKSSFEHGGTAYTIDQLRLGRGSGAFVRNLTFRVDQDIPSAVWSRLTLRVGTEDVLLSDSDVAAGRASNFFGIDTSNDVVLLTDGTPVLAKLVTNHPAAGAPAISGRAQVAEVLTASTDGITDANGLIGVSYGYQWIRVDGATETDIAGATSMTYTPVAADEGKQVRVKVTFRDDSGNAEALTSGPYPASGGIATANNPATGDLTISGRAQVAEELTAELDVVDDDGLVNASNSYQWILVDGATETDIAGATLNTYTPVAADEGKHLRVRVSFVDDAGNPEELTSATYPVESRILAANNPAKGNVGMDRGGECRPDGDRGG